MSSREFGRKKDVYKKTVSLQTEKSILQDLGSAAFQVSGQCRPAFLRRVHPVPWNLLFSAFGL